MPDRSWEHGLHQLIEAKEGVRDHRQRETLARISYQRFFRRYLQLARHDRHRARGRRRAVGGLPAARRAHADQPAGAARATCRDRVFARAEARSGRRWPTSSARACGRAAGAGRHALGGGVRAAVARCSTQAGRRAPACSTRARTPTRPRSWRRPGERGRITVATNMAGRGTDIKLGAGRRRAGRPARDPDRAPRVARASTASSSAAAAARATRAAASHRLARGRDRRRASFGRYAARLASCRRAPAGCWLAPRSAWPSATARAPRATARRRSLERSARLYRAA